MIKQATKCPHCGKLVNLFDDIKYRPFCCERCLLIDLGEWLNGDKRIVSKLSIDNEDIGDDSLVN